MKLDNFDKNVALAEPPRLEEGEVHMIAKVIALLAIAAIFAGLFLGWAGFFTEQEVAEWARILLVPLAGLAGVVILCWRIAKRECERPRGETPYYGIPPDTPPEGRGKETEMKMKRIVPVLILALALPLVAACATRPYDPRPAVIFVPPAERAAPQEKLPPRVEGSENPCGIPAPIVAFVGAGNKGIYNRNMPSELRFVTGDWARCAGGVLVDSYNAPLVFEWGYNVETVNVSTFGAYHDGTVGGFIAGRIMRGLGAVADGITLNGSRLGGGNSVNYVNRVTIWFFLTGTNSAGVRQLAFQGRGVAAYLDNTNCGRQCGFEGAAIRALKNMH